MSTPFRDLTDVTLMNEYHYGLDDHNECYDPVYHDNHDDFEEDEDGDVDEYQIFFNIKSAVFTFHIHQSYLPYHIIAIYNI